ncbi:MAG: hypothetical protein ABWK01_01520 [Infirmifilum sp.]
MGQLSSQLLEIESRLRELATNIQQNKTSFYDFDKEISLLTGKVGNLGSMLPPPLHIGQEEKISKYSTTLETLYDALINLDSAYFTKVRIAIFTSGYQGEESELTRNVVIDDDLAINRIKELDEAVKEIAGQGCVSWESNTMASFLNDLASCTHILAKKLQEVESSLNRESEKCWVEGEAEPSLVKTCKVWDVATSELNENGLYDPLDYKNLGAVVSGKRIHFRVGSRTGHEAIIDLERGRLKFYNGNKTVNRMMSTLLEEEAGLSCKVHDKGVICKGVDEDKAAKATLLLSFATSMKYRLGDPAKYWGEEVVRNLEVNKTRELYKDLAKKLLAK